MPWSGGAEPSLTTGGPISVSSVVLLYVKHPVRASAHDEALSGTLLVSGGLGVVLASDHATPYPASRILC